MQITANSGFVCREQPLAFVWENYKANFWGPGPHSDLRKYLHYYYSLLLLSPFTDEKGPGSYMTLLRSHCRWGAGGPDSRLSCCSQPCFFPVHLAFWPLEKSKLVKSVSFSVFLLSVGDIIEIYEDHRRYALTTVQLKVANSMKKGNTT